MKKTLFVLALVAALMLLAIPVVSAGMDYEDPALCVNGNWLLVDAAHPSGIRVTVPEDARYGGQKAGKCNTPPPASLLITNVKEGESEHLMIVWVNGSQATTPTITVSYDGVEKTQTNNGNWMMFVFKVD